MKNILRLSILFFVLANLLQAATSMRVYWYRSAESSYEVQLAKMADAWNDADNAVGVWVAANLSYYFELDIDNFDEYDATSLYKILEDGSTVANYLMLGDAEVADSLRDHVEASSSVHGTSSAIVGLTDSQVLTNKTVDGDDNTVQDLHGWSLSAGTSTRAIVIHPNTGQDTYLFADIADASSITLQASDTAKTSDRKLTLIAGSIDLQTDGGSNIVITGVADDSDATSAVTRASLDSVKSRLNNLEIGGAFTGSPEVYLELVSGRGYRSPNIIADFEMDVTNMDSVSHWEIYYSNSVIFGITSGSTDDSELRYLRGNAHLIIISGSGASYHTLRPEGEMWVVATAFDATGIAYNSDTEHYSPGGLIPGRDGDGEIIELTRTIISPNVHSGTATGNTAAEFSDFLQADVSATTKVRGVWLCNGYDSRMYAYFYAKTASGTGYLRLQIMNSTTVVGSVTETFDITAYPATPLSCELDLTSGFTAGMLYEIEVDIWSSASQNTNLRDDFTLEVVSQVPIY